eukprot:bmy_11514T0
MKTQRPEVERSIDKLSQIDAVKRFALPVTATAENCILTLYLYMAIHLDEQKIILKNEKDASSVKAGSKVLLANREAGLPSPAPSKFSDAEPEKGRLFVGMEIIPERLNSGKSEMSKKSNRSMEKEVKDEQFFSPEEGTKTYDFFQKVIRVVRNAALLMLSQNGFSKYNKTIYDVMLHLSGKMPPGITSSQSLPVDYTERMIQLHLQHSSLRDFLSAQGACISHVLPEFLLEPEDYEKWIEITSSTNTLPKFSNIPKEKHSIVIDITKFEAWSKWAWTDVFLQTYQAASYIILSTDKEEHLHNRRAAHVLVYGQASTNLDVIPSERWIVNFDRDLLDGLVFATLLGAYCPFLIESHFVNMYTQPKSSEQYLHNCLIIVNVLREIGFDMDIQVFTLTAVVRMDLDERHWKQGTQYNKNAIAVGQGEKLLTSVIPIQSDAHVLCLHRYKTLQRTFSTVFCTILLKNSSLKNLLYNATIIRRDATDFSLSQGKVVTVSPNRFLHPAEASLLLISKPKNGTGGTTMTFALKGEVLNFKAIATIKCQSPCYKWKEITVNVKNPFHPAGDFSVIFVESSTFISLPSQLTEVGEFVDHMNDGVKNIDQHQIQTNQLASTYEMICKQALLHVLAAIKSNFIKEFFCPTHTLHLGAKGTSSLELFFLPFGMHTRYCVIIFSNKKTIKVIDMRIGELIYVLEGRVLNKEDPVLYLKCKLRQILDVDLKLPLANEAKEKALAFAAQQQMSKIEYERRLITGILESSSVRVAIALLGLTKIKVGMEDRGCAEISLSLKIKNSLNAKNNYRRVDYASLRKSATPNQNICMLFNISKLKKPKSILYKTELSLPEHFDIPKTICIPRIPETQAKLTQYQGTKSAEKTAIPDLKNPSSANEVSSSFPRGVITCCENWSHQKSYRWICSSSFTICSSQSWTLPCKILLTSRYDVRVYCTEGVVNEERPEARFDFETPAFEALTQNIPINNKTKNEWKCQVTIEGEWFYGPPVLHVGPGETVNYPLTFKPTLECEIMGKLTLQNEVDGMEHIFDIKGIGKRPLALEHITIDCQVGEITNKPIMVPNYTTSILTFKVSSDLPMVWGNPDITIDPDNAIPYILHVMPLETWCIQSKAFIDTNCLMVPEKNCLLGNGSEGYSYKAFDERGGTISFSVKSRQNGDSQEDSDEDKDRDLIPSFEKSLSEPSDKFDEEKPGDGSSLPHMQKKANAIISPSCIIKLYLNVVKHHIVSVEIQRKMRVWRVGIDSADDAISNLQIWYYLEIHSAPGPPLNTIEVKCIALESVCIEIRLFNPKEKLIHLDVQLSSAAVSGLKELVLFPLDSLNCVVRYSPATTGYREERSTRVDCITEQLSNVLIIPPHSTKDVSVHFRPSPLGRAGHQTSITFHCAQFKEWIFYISGRGLFPQPLEIERMTTYLRLQSSVLIPFQNSTKEDVLIDIILTGRWNTLLSFKRRRQEKHKRLVLAPYWDSFLEETSAFKLSGLSHTKGETVMRQMILIFINYSLMKQSCYLGEYLF